MISAIVCTYNRASFLPRAIESLSHCETKNYEILIVDNNSSDDSAVVVSKIASNHPALPLRYVFEPKQGLSNARNRGIAESHGEVLLFIDDDAYVCENYLDKLESHLAAEGGYGIFGGKITPEFLNCPPPKWLCRWSLGWVSGLDLGNRAMPFPKGKYPFGGNSAIRRGVIEKVGQYNPALGRNARSMAGGEEKDLYRRAVAAGEKMFYCPDLELFHLIPAERTTLEYVDRYADGIGTSERERSKQEGSYPRRVFTELIKWAGSLVLALAYLCTLRPECAGALLRFRAHVSRNLLRKS